MWKRDIFRSLFPYIMISHLTLSMFAFSACIRQTVTESSIPTCPRIAELRSSLYSNLTIIVLGLFASVLRHHGCPPSTPIRSITSQFGCDRRARWLSTCIQSCLFASFHCGCIPWSFDGARWRRVSHHEILLTSKLLSLFPSIFFYSISMVFFFDAFFCDVLARA